MKRAALIVGILVGLSPALARAEVRQIRQTIFGMD